MEIVEGRRHKAIDIPSEYEDGEGFESADLEEINEEYGIFGMVMFKRLK